MGRIIPWFSLAPAFAYIPRHSGNTDKANIDNFGIYETLTGDWELLAEHKASTTESSFTFTPSPAITATSHSMVIIIIEMTPTAALTLELLINGLVADYFTDGTSTAGGTVTAVNLGTTTEWDIVVFDAVIKASCIIELIPPDTDSNDLAGLSRSSGGLTGSNSRYLGLFNNTNDINDINEIKLETDTSTWIAGTTIRIYGVKAT